jgi:hypothetical protein
MLGLARIFGFLGRLRLPDQQQSAERSGQVVKELGYLLDNQCCSIISLTTGWDQGESGWTLKAVPEMEHLGLFPSECGEAQG